MGYYLKELPRDKPEAPGKQSLPHPSTPPGPPSPLLPGRGRWTSSVLARAESLIKFRHTHPCTLSSKFRAMEIKPWAHPKAKGEAAMASVCGSGSEPPSPQTLAARQSYKMCLDLIFPLTQPQMRPPGSAGAAVQKPYNLFSPGSTASIGSGRGYIIWGSGLPPPGPFLFQYLSKT